MWIGFRGMDQTLITPGVWDGGITLRE
ncbi:protein of unknown function [Paraburkholderia dioscoreae]|uniref:Uncharacterized protein n=1 Tax=Paraburkholderia dioscoreae TaxID=2604047 RepID=A0A5Q4ZCF5_9BURK|nr:protein of unknown function [Paraburkholderia dioscoreae]